MTTPEQIAKQTDHLSGLANTRAINKIFREQDDSHLWPIRGRFNVTERAIRKARQFQRDTGAVYGLEYAYLLDSIIGQEVNNEGNW
jgi:hypothetical protein